ncbi:MAG: DUF5686 and carboxypeptidase regulatory-like domain-containing protein [Flavobacteriaceae bacterium]
MIKQLLFIGFFLVSTIVNSQIIGKVTDSLGTPLPFVNVFIENSYTGTTTNDDGNYKLDPNGFRDDKQEKATIVFQYLGFKTQKKELTFDKKVIVLNVVLEPETFSLDQVVITSGENPADRIVRMAIENRKQNSEKLNAYTADFYSRGLWKMKDVPVKIMGQEVGDLDGALDSTRTGIVYLSETISKIAFQKPNDFFERIVASKVSGNDNGFSFNSARDANFSFYESTIDINASLVSPIANNAFNYYTYKLEGVFYENGQLINRIRVTPKRTNDRIFSGLIYIVEDSWQLYGVELTTNGSAIQVPFIEELVFKQNFSFDDSEDFWVKRSQTIDFSFGFMGFNGDGRFTAVYSNYDFNPEFDGKTFSNEVLFFEPEANKKDTLFWTGIRPVPLTDEEINDYVRRDSIQTLRQSKSYLDSIDQTTNKFKILNPITGYSYSNTYKKWRMSYNGVLTGINFNTLQGWNATTGLSFNKWYDENRTRTLSANLNANYGIADDQLRLSGSISKRFNRLKRNTISLSAGKKVQQFNASEPISQLINTVSSLFFERNFLKAYDLTYARINYNQELFNGLRFWTGLGYEERQPLFNQTDQVTINNKGVSYTSNNPLAPDDFENAAIDSHQIWKSSLAFAIRFGQKYMTYPDGKFNLGNSDYPAINLFHTKGFAASKSNLNFDQLHIRVFQSVNLKNKGRLDYNLKSGTFINGDDISFADYQHFNGNQTRVGTTFNYTNVFNLLPYYALSTNGSYFEGHLEHDFKGFILGKFPLINKLNYNLVAGAHFLSTENNKPYTEVSIGMDNLGFGKFRFLRLDYVHSFFEGADKGAFIFGLKFLNIIE